MLYDSDPTRPDPDEAPSTAAGSHLWQPPAFEILLVIALLFGAIASLHCHSLLPLATSLMVMLVASRKRRKRHSLNLCKGPLSRVVTHRRRSPAPNPLRTICMAQPPTASGKPNRRP
ncbi:MAG: hypothetical protein KA754_01100 [Corallincola sp.]|nr:hypothetical protein [Corallincola sp.]